MIKTISASELKTQLEQRQPLILLDVREDFEHRMAQIPGSLLIPQSQLRQNLDRLDHGRPVVVICHHGLRSLLAAKLLINQGFKDVSNLEGGIDAWSLIDPSVPRY